jgi:hypothetical protein
MPWAVRQHRNAPTSAKVWFLILFQALGTELEAEIAARAVIDAYGQNPSQLPRRMALAEQSAVVDVERSTLDNVVRRSSAAFHLVEQPFWSESINVAIPKLSLLPEHSIAKGLQLQPVSLGASGDPRCEQLVRQRLGMSRP